MKTIILILFVYYILFGDATYTITVKNKAKYQLKYNGCVWVVLDRYSIWKYHSADKPMRIFSYNKTKF